MQLAKLLPQDGIKLLLQQVTAPFTQDVEQEVPEDELELDEFSHKPLFKNIEMLPSLLAVAKSNFESLLKSPVVIKTARELVG